jgi:hypothetical protein
MQPVAHPKRGTDVLETNMNIRLFLALALTLFAVSACVVEPMGGRGHYGGGHEYGRAVWRG